MGYANNYLCNNEKDIIKYLNLSLKQEKFFYGDINKKGS